MSRIALPDVLTQQQAARQMVFNLRCEIAKEVFAHLVAGDYQAAIAKARREADPFDTKASESDGDGEEYQFRIDLSCPARTAVAAADVLLVTLGIIPAPQAQGAARATPYSHFKPVQQLGSTSVLYRKSPTWRPRGMCRTQPHSRPA